MCVFFHIGGATFCICTCILVFKILYITLCLYLSFQMCTPNIRRQKHLQNRLEKNNLFGNFHTCVEKPTHVKNKNTNNYIKTNTLYTSAPPRFQDFLQGFQKCFCFMISLSRSKSSSLKPNLAGGVLFVQVTSCIKMRITLLG